MPVPERPGFTKEQLVDVIKYIRHETIANEENLTKRITSSHIIPSCNLRSLFHLTDIIHHLRTKWKLPICSGRKGYWWGDSLDCQDTGAKLIARGNKMAQAGKALCERKDW